MFQWKMLYLIYPDTFADKWSGKDLEQVTEAVVQHGDWYEAIAGGKILLQFGLALCQRHLGPDDVSSVTKEGARRYQLRPDDVRNDLVQMGVPRDVYGTVGGLIAWGRNPHGGRQAGGMAFPHPHLHVHDKDTNFWSVGYVKESQNPFALFHEFTHCLDFVFKRSFDGVGIGNIDKIRTYVKDVLQQRPGWYSPPWDDATMEAAADRALAGKGGLSPQQQARTIRYFLDRPVEDFDNLNPDYGTVVEAPSGVRCTPVFLEIYADPGAKVFLPVVARDEQGRTLKGEVQARIGNKVYALTKRSYTLATEGIPYSREYFAGWIELPTGTNKVEIELVADGQVDKRAEVAVYLSDALKKAASS